MGASADEPDSVDWREEGYVTPVKNQGQCGSCWAFSAVVTMEGAQFKKSGNLVSLSEQQLMDCDHKDMACNGGLPQQAIDYVITQGGIDTEDSYPYAMRKHSSCQYDEANKGATITAVTHLRRYRRLPLLIPALPRRSLPFHVLLIHQVGPRCSCCGI